MYDSPVDIYKDYLISKSTNSKSTANKLASLERNQKQIDSNKQNIETSTTNKSSSCIKNLTYLDKEKVEQIKKSKFFKTINS